MPTWIHVGVGWVLGDVIPLWLPPFLGARRGPVVVLGLAINGWGFHEDSFTGLQRWRRRRAPPRRLGVVERRRDFQEGFGGLAPGGLSNGGNPGTDCPDIEGLSSERRRHKCLWGGGGLESGPRPSHSPALPQIAKQRSGAKVHHLRGISARLPRWPQPFALRARRFAAQAAVKRAGN